MRLSKAMSITAAATLLLAASALCAVEVFAHDDNHHDRHERYRESREYPHIHGDWRKPYVPPRTHDRERSRDDSYLLDDDDYQDQRKSLDYLSDDESDE